MKERITMEFFKKPSRKKIDTYLKHCRSDIEKGKQHIPPTTREIDNLISYLNEKDLNPIIVGSLAIVQHLNFSLQELEREDFRPTEDIDIFVSSLPHAPPSGWRRDYQSIGVISWISPSGGYVDFLEAGQKFPDSQKNLTKVKKDPNSENMGLPTADLSSLFQLKLNSSRVKDIQDLIFLSERVGIPDEIEKKNLNELQKENLAFIRLWLENKKQSKHSFRSR